MSVAWVYAPDEHTTDVDPSILWDFVASVTMVVARAWAPDERRTYRGRGSSLHPFILGARECRDGREK